MTGAIARWLDRLARPGRPDEYETKQLLASSGLAVPRGVRLAPEQPVAAIAELAPLLAIKVCSPDVVHKSDVAGVMLEVTAAAAADAIATMRSRFPATPILVEEQVTISGPELIAGALVDPEFGAAIMVGAGGVLTELYRDVAFRLAPCPTAEIERMLGELTIAPLFDGYRGQQLDRPGLAAALGRLADLAVSLGPMLGQLDINPLAQVAGRWLALDAMLTLMPRSS